MTLMLGKTQARPDAVTFKLATYLPEVAKLPPVPPTFGHEDLLPADLGGMLGNDQYGDCVWAMLARAIMLATAEGGKPAHFDTASVLAAYSAATGFDPNDPSTDNGTDMAYAASWMRKHGMKDANGVVHKAAAYLALEPGNFTQHMQAAYLFGSVSVGIRFVDYAMTEFNDDKPWAVERGGKIEGGHGILLLCRRGLTGVATWGKLQMMTSAFLRKFNDESYVIVDWEMLKNGTTPEGFNAAQLTADLKAL